MDRHAGAESEEELNAALKEAWDQSFAERRERQRLEERMSALLALMDDHQPGASAALLAALDGASAASSSTLGGAAAGASPGAAGPATRLGTVDL